MVAAGGAYDVHVRQADWATRPRAVPLYQMVDDDPFQRLVELVQLSPAGTATPGETVEPMGAPLTLPAAVGAPLAQR